MTPRIEAEPGAEHALVIFDDVEGWCVQWTVEIQNGVPVVRDLTLAPAQAEVPSGGITSNLLRELSPLRAIERIPWRFDRDRLSTVVGEVAAS